MRDAIVTVGLILVVLSVWADASQAHAGFIIGMESQERPRAPSMGEAPSGGYDYWSEPGSSRIVFWETGGNSPSPRADSLRQLLSILRATSHNSPRTRGAGNNSVNSFESQPDGLYSRPDVLFSQTIGRVFLVCLMPSSTPFLADCSALCGSSAEKCPRESVFPLDVFLLPTEREVK